MEHRLFIAINLPKEIKASIRDILQIDQEQNTELYEHARMTDEESWHITLVFLGAQSEDQLKALIGIIREAVRQVPAPKITMRMLTTAPPHRPPRMIWIATTAETNRLLEEIKTAIEQKLAAQNIFKKGESYTMFNGHITLARLPEGRRIANRTILFPCTLSFKPTTIDLMESHLKNTETSYRLLESIDFKQSA